MRSAMQNAIKEIVDLWSSPGDDPSYTKILEVLKKHIPEEKQQIIEAYHKGYQHYKPCYRINDAHDYYNETFEQ